jgi:hypothetical protein
MLVKHCGQLTGFPHGKDGTTLASIPAFYHVWLKAKHCGFGCRILPNPIRQVALQGNVHISVPVVRVFWTRNPDVF